MGVSHAGTHAQVEAASRRWGWADVGALAALLLAILLVYNKVLFTNLVPAAGDYLFYFTPYWDYANEALRAGRLPLWNPFMFAGAPFQANPQTQLFYPLRWLFVPITAEKGILYFAGLHAWLAGALTYALARRAARVGAGGALAAGLIFALNGWTTGLLAAPVRWGAVPWLPAALLLWEMLRAQPLAWTRRTRRLLVGLALVWTLALLAGHSQTFYNEAVIFAFWVVFSWAWDLRRTWKEVGRLSGRQIWTRAWPTMLLLALMFALALALSAVQTLPTLELTGQSYRSGGLAYREHAALSLPPWRLGFSLLPHYGRDLGQALGSDAFAEWLAYVGIVGLLLALLGLTRGPRRIRALAVAVTILGVALALGAYNPLDYVLTFIMPGWNLFRVPARWLEATVLGLALLAGLGLDAFVAGWRLYWRRPRRWWGYALAVGLVSLLAAALITRPNLLTVAAWLIALLAFVLLLWTPSRFRHLGAAALLILLLLELYAASWGLPIQHPTAPQAVRSWRTAPARIAAELGPEPRDDACRTLSLSTTTYDPGDLADLRQIYGPFLDAQALSDLENATKAKEVLAPNLGLLYRLPSFDGFGGGVLPTRHFVQTMGLFLPPDQLVADGRLREQLREVPDARLLSLFHVCYVITDKTFDVWQDGVYYDLAFGETLSLGNDRLSVTGLPTFPATHLGVVSHVLGDAPLVEGEQLAEIRIRFADGTSASVPLNAGIDTATPATDIPGLPTVPWRYDQPGHDFIARLPLPHSGQITALDLRLLRADVRLFVRGLAVIDEISGAHATPPISRRSWRRIHSGDVKIYRNDEVFPHAFLAPTATRNPDDDLALAGLLTPDFGLGAAEIVSYAPERIRIRIKANAPATLVLADAWYPGWRATLDGEPAPIYRANVLLQSISVPAGEHQVTFTFSPVSLHWGAAVTLLALLILASLFLWPERSASGAEQNI